MDRFRSGKTMSPIRQAEAYWCALREGADVPRRSQIDPRGLENILEYALIIERIAPGVARFRLAGHHLSKLMGMEVRGMPLTTFIVPKARGQIAAVLETLFDTPSVAELTLRSDRRSGSDRDVRPLEARMILLPLKSDLGDVNRALGVLVADGEIGQTPNRFDLVATNLRPVNGAISALQSREDFAPNTMYDPVPGFGEAQDPMAGSVGRAAPHLRVVK